MLLGGPQSRHACVVDSSPYARCRRVMSHNTNGPTHLFQLSVMCRNEWSMPVAGAQEDKHADR